MNPSPANGLKHTLSLRSVQVALAVAAVTGAALCPSRLFGITGPESALVLGIVLPPVAAVAASLWVSRLRARDETLPFSTLATGALVGATVITALPTVMLLLNQLRVRHCTPWKGMAFIALGPFLGVLLACALGVALACLLNRRWAAVSAVLVPLGVAGIAIYRVITTPAVFVYTPFAGHYPGALYDRVVRITDSYLTFRSGTLLMIGGILLLTATFWDPVLCALRPRVRCGAWLFLALTLFGGELSIHAFGKELGHRTSSPFVYESLGATEGGSKCVIHVPRELSLENRKKLLSDCEFRIHQAEQALGVTQAEPIHAIFFRSPSEKKRLMGAATTYVAKPWRNEVYLQLREIPHPVLFHEIVHVVAGNTGRGPFRISGRLGGLWPNPALIEGVAVGVAWDAREGLTPHQWARAMVELDLMPRLSDVVTLSFLRNPPARAYTLTGSVVRYLLDTRGPKVVRDAYRTGDLATAAGQSLEELEAEWLAFIMTVPLPEDAMGLARVRFEPGSVFTTTCPRLLAQLEEELAGALTSGDDEYAVESCQAILSIEPNATGTRASYMAALQRLGRSSEAETQLKQLVGPPAAPGPVLSRARQELADQHWREGNTKVALSVYKELLSQPITDDAARSLEVKVIALESDDDALKRAVFDVLVGEAHSSAASAVVADRLARMRELREDGLGDYLWARQLYYASSPEAAELFALALQRGLPTPRIQKETQRMLALAHYANGDRAAARTAFDTFRNRAGATEGEKVFANDWLDRIAFENH